MQDQPETFSGATPLPAAPRRRTGRRILTGLVLLLLVGLGIGGWLVWTGKLDLLFPQHNAETAGSPKSSTPVAAAGSGPVSPQALPSPAGQPSTLPVGAIEARLALIEDRLSRLDLQATAASGNAARAEGMLIAFAARRMIDRGSQLGYLEDQLKLRFADAQPNAVRIIIEAGHSPVTLDGLVSQLDALAPKLNAATPADDSWTRVKRELAGLFIIRHEVIPEISAEDRVQRAKLMLAAGRAGDAINEVQRLPGSAAAAGWIASVRRYDQTQRALDLIETTAMLDSHNLQDSQGRRVEQASPLAGPTDSPSPSPKPAI
jgi:hypothetical protein